MVEVILAKSLEPGLGASYTEADGVGPPYRHRVRNGRQHGDLSVPEMNGMRKFGVFEWFRETGSLAIVGKLWKA